MKNGVESRQHPIRWNGMVEVEAAVDVSRPAACLIRNALLNQRVRSMDALVASAKARNGA